MRKDRHIRKNNQGFTILEVLVVLAIVAILTTMAGLTIGIVNNANVSKAATRFESMLTRSRAQSIAMGPDAGQLTLTKENGKLYGQIGTGEKEEICNKHITVYFGDIALATGMDAYNETTVFMGSPMADGASYVVRFSPAGNVMKNDTGGNLCKMIFKRNKKQVEVVLYRQTGKHLSRAF